MTKHMLQKALVLALLMAAGGTDTWCQDTIFLDDRESHSWFRHTDTDVGSELFSPSPIDIRVTYRACGILDDYTTTVSGVAVGIDEPEDTYVYMLTLERADGSSAAYHYTTIANPFSLRPNHTVYGGWKGFKCWRLKVVGGSCTVEGTTTDAGQTVAAAETRLTIMPSEGYGSREKPVAVELEAVWTTARRVTSQASGLRNALASTSLSASGTYETNFIVLTSGNTTTDIGSVTGQRPATVTMVEPDGSVDYRSAGRYLGGSFAANADTKFEYITLNASNKTYTAGNGNSLVLGRGIGVTTDGAVAVGHVRAIGSGVGSNYSPTNLRCRLRIETGKYRQVSFVYGANLHNTSPNSYYSINCYGTANYVHATLGSDYDRAGSGNNSRLQVTDAVAMSYQCYFVNQTTSALTLEATIKSGSFITRITDFNGNEGSASDAIYMGMANAAGSRAGCRVLTLEGGVLPNVAGGVDRNNSSSDHSFTLRMKGSALNPPLVQGCVYGCGAFAATSGKRRFIVTRGRVRGWMAGGCNGTLSTLGQVDGWLNGNTYIYLGGEAEVGYRDGTTPPHINYSDGGNVFGAGSGNDHIDEARYATVGQVDNSTVVVADEAFVQHDVYGGGNYGYVNTGGTARLLTAGNATIGGRLFGGSNQRKGAAVDIVMHGGTVVQGLYGGSNLVGVVSGPVSIRLERGTVGQDGVDDPNLGNVYGSGRGDPGSAHPDECRVDGPISIVVGNPEQAWPHSNDPTVYGNVYCGGHNAPHTVNGTFSVTTYNGRIVGSVFGGGQGASAVVRGDTHVYILGTSLIETNVYGGGDAGLVTGNTNIDIGGVSTSH